MRTALGFPDELYDEFFNSGDSRANANPYRTTTPLFLDMTLATELGKSMKEWHQMDRVERRCRIYHRILTLKKEEYQEQEARAKADRERQFKESLPKVLPSR
jgi:hypothetical protein